MYGRYRTTHADLESWAGCCVGIMSLLNPTCRDLTAALDKADAKPFHRPSTRCHVFQSYWSTNTERSSIDKKSDDINGEYLCSLPDNMVGRAHADWLDREEVSPDTRDGFKYIDEEECAYVTPRYHECHDFFHTLTRLPVMVEEEVALKAFEFGNTVLPMTGTSGFGVTRLKPAETKWLGSKKVFSAAAVTATKNLVLDLILALQNQPASRFLPSRCLPSRIRDRTLAGDLGILYGRVDSNQLDIASAIPLVERS